MSPVHDRLTQPLMKQNQKHKVSYIIMLCVQKKLMVPAHSSLLELASSRESEHTVETTKLAAIMMQLFP